MSENFNQTTITNHKKGGTMSPAQEIHLLARDLELARRLISANQTRPFWHERQLDTESKNSERVNKVDKSLSRA